MRSVERYLLGWIAGALSLGLLLVTIVIYLVTLEEIDEVFDTNLRNVAMAVAAAQNYPAQPVAAPAVVRPVAVLDEGDIVTQTWTRGGIRLFSSDPTVTLPFTDVEGLSRPQVDQHGWIVYALVQNDRVVQAAQRKMARREAAQESAAKILLPMLLLILAVSGLIVIALRRGLRPLDAAARDVAARSEHSLTPIETDAVPRELLPLAVSINDLMARLSAAMTAQRQFLADAAHELRTPATALRLQLQLLKSAPDPAARALALAELEAGVNRSQRLIEQLLLVSRSGPDGEPMKWTSVELGALARDVVGTMIVKADAREIDLGAETGPEVRVSGDASQLTVLLNNLVENAVRYTPTGGQVDVTVGLSDGRPVVRVIDNGPGISPEDRERVFDRFFRGAPYSATEGDARGSGLGLAIVKAIAVRHHATVDLLVPAAGRGLEVCVTFPEVSSLKDCPVAQPGAHLSGSQ